MIFRRLADGIISHAKIIVVLWIVVLLLSVYPAIRAADNLSYDTSSMGTGNTESMEGARIIDTYFDSFGSAETMQIILVTYTEAEEEYMGLVSFSMVSLPDENDKLESVVIGGQYSNEHGKMMMYAATYKAEDQNGNKISVSDDTGNLRNLVQKEVSEDIPADHMGNVKTYVTGTPAIEYDASKTMNKDLAIIDPFAILMILILVGLFFRSFVSSAAPPITIGVAFALVMCALFFLGQIFDIYYLTEVLLLVSMLGAGCDYCIFILSRYREERRSGKDHIPACREAITWAGESVATSGAAVIIGFGAMMVCSFGLIKYMGMGLAVGIVFALLAALTLMSSLLVLFGDRLFWPSGTTGPKLERGYMRKMGKVAASYFKRSSRFSIRHAKGIVAATLLFTVPMVYVYATSEDSYDIIGSMMNGDSKEGMNTMVEYAGGGAIMPNYAVIETDKPVATVYHNQLMWGDLGFLTWNDTDDTAVKTMQQLQEMMTESSKQPNVSATYLSPFDNLGLSDKGIPDTCPRWVQIVDYLQAELDWQPYFDVIDALVYLEDPNCIIKLPTTTAAMVRVAIEEVFSPIEKKLGRIAYNSDIACQIMDWLMYLKTGALGDDSDTATVTNVIYAKVTMETKEQAMSDNSIKTLSNFKEYVHNPLTFFPPTCWVR